MNHDIYALIAELMVVLSNFDNGGTPHQLRSRKLYMIDLCEDIMDEIEAL